MKTHSHLECGRLGRRLDRGRTERGRELRGTNGLTSGAACSSSSDAFLPFLPPLAFFAVEADPPGPYFASIEERNESDRLAALRWIRAWREEVSSSAASSASSWKLREAEGQRRGQ